MNFTPNNADCFRLLGNRAKKNIFLHENFSTYCGNAGIPAIVVPHELHIAADSEKIKISVFDSLDMLVIA